MTSMPALEVAPAARLAELERLSPADRRRRLLARWELARRHPLPFLFWFVNTLDPHDHEHPIKSFPAHRPYIQQLVKLWQENPLLIVLKARQMLCTWLFCAVSLWEVMFHAGRTVVLQSETHDKALGNRVKATGLLGRCQFILDHLPPGVPVPRFTDKVEELTFAHNSGLIPIPQGKAMINSHSATGVFTDEAALQPQFGEAIGEAFPVVRGGGWLVAISAADMIDAGAFRRLVRDEPDPDGVAT